MDQHESSWPEKFVNPRIGLSIDKGGLSIFSKQKTEKKFLATYIRLEWTIQRVHNNVKKNICLLKFDFFCICCKKDLTFCFQKWFYKKSMHRVHTLHAAWNYSIILGGQWTTHRGTFGNRLIIEPDTWSPNTLQNISTTSTLKLNPSRLPFQLWDNFDRPPQRLNTNLWSLFTS